MMKIKILLISHRWLISSFLGRYRQHVKCILWHMHRACSYYTILAFDTAFESYDRALKDEINIFQHRFNRFN